MSAPPLPSMPMATAWVSSSSTTVRNPPVHRVQSVRPSGRVLLACQWTPPMTGETMTTAQAQKVSRLWCIACWASTPAIAAYAAGQHRWR